ncbi:reverse transcriptase domain-containing protein [Tanacetum coccineum]
MPHDCLRIIESKSKGRNSRNKPVVAKVSLSSSTPGISPDVAKLKDMVKTLLLDKKTQAPAPVKRSRKVMLLAVALILIEIVTPPMATFIVTIFKRTLPSNTITNPKVDLKGITTRSGVAYQGPTIPTTSSSPPKVVERETEVTKDTMLPTNNGSTKDVQPPVYFKRREKANDQIEKFYEIFKDLSFEISLTDALILMPKFASTLKALIGNKEKLSEMARIPLNEHCSVVILNKLPEKLGDPSKFIIACDFPVMDECLALADLCASINLMPLSVWKKLCLSELTPTYMTLELADCSISQPIGIAEDVDVKVGKFQFPADFVVVDVDAIPEVPP